MTSPGPACLFCKIASGEIPAAKVLETDRALAFLDIGPLNPGHLLLVPKDHYATLTDLPDELASLTAALLPRLGRAVMAATGAEGLNVLVNVGQVAGQTIHHVHWHLIPRHPGDPLKWPWPAGRYEGEALDAMRARIEQAL